MSSIDDENRILAAAALQSQEKPDNWELLEKELRKIPAIGKRDTYWGADSKTKVWWCTFQLDHSHPNVFDTIYAVGHSLNRFDATDFAGAFYPTGPYYGLNENPNEYLEWMIDSFHGLHGPEFVANELEIAILHLMEINGRDTSASGKKNLFARLFRKN